MLARQVIRLSWLSFSRRNHSWMSSGIRRQNALLSGRIERVIPSFVALQVRHAMADTMQQVDPPKKQTFAMIEERVLKAIKAWDRFPQASAEKLTLDVDFSKELGMDSLDHVEMIMSIESEFKLEFDEDTAETFTSPRKIYDFMCAHFEVYE